MSVVRRVLWFLLVFHGYTVARIPSDYYTKKEEQVKRMAAEILKLDAARCDWAANCSSSTCSRHACTPIDGFDDPTKYNFTCQQQIEPNPYCSSFARSCYSRKINNAMSYVRMAPTPTSITSISPIPEEMCSTICMTRDFTSTMKTLASENDHANDVHESFFFGSVDGVYRFYPGEELSDRCYNFDPRKRTWYNGAISLPTYLIVLIDNSSFSNDRTNSPLMYTALDYSKVIVKDLIYTPSANDMLDVIVFNQTTPVALSTSPVSIQDDTELGEFQDGRKTLIDLINKISHAPDSIETSYVGGFVQAISIALQRRTSIHSTLNTVILMFTSGSFASNLQLADQLLVSTMLKSNFTKLFIYSFENSSNLQALAKESDGYYETIIDKFDNPLYQISNFFNFMALARNVSLNEPYWTKFYKDFEGRGNITTVSYQVLSPDGHLVGVVAIDVILGLGQGNLPDNAGNRPTKLNGTIFVNTEVTPRINICKNCNGNEALCDNPTKKAFIYLECCDSCIPDSDKRSVGKKIVEICVPLVVVLALFISVAIWWVWRRRKRCGISQPVTTDSWPYE